MRILSLFQIAIIQLITVSEAKRTLAFTTWHDREIMGSFWMIYEYLRDQKATVKHLYLYLQQFSMRYNQSSLFEFIFSTLVSSLATN